MAAATVTGPTVLRDDTVGHWQQFTLSVLTAGQTETVALLSSAPARAISELTWVITAAPTDRSTVHVHWLNASATNKTPQIRVDPATSGTLDGCSIVFTVKYNDQGGI